MTLFTLYIGCSVATTYGRFHAPTAARAVVAAVAALEAADAAAVARKEPLLNCGTPVGAVVTAPCSRS